MRTSPLLKMREWLEDRRGSTAIEYALIATVVAISAIGALVAFGSESGGMWQDTGTSLTDGLRSTR